jgi:hypothetical protein
MFKFLAQNCRHHHSLSVKIFSPYYWCFDDALCTLLLSQAFFACYIGSYPSVWLGNNTVKFSGPLGFRTLYQFDVLTLDVLYTYISYLCGSLECHFLLFITISRSLFPLHCCPYAVSA